MALYSVWDWNRNVYRVYADRRPVSVGDDPDPPRPGRVHILGAVPDEHVKRLPKGARFVSYSHAPRGEIVRHPAVSGKAMGGLGALADRHSGIVEGALVGAGVAVLLGYPLQIRRDWRAQSVFRDAALGAGIGVLYGLIIG